MRDYQEFNNFVRLVKELIEQEDYSKAALLLEEGLKAKVSVLPRFYFRVYLKLNRFEDAEFYLGKLISKCESQSKALYYKGLFYFLQNDIENSLVSLKECFKRDIDYLKKFMIDDEFEILRGSQEIMELITPTKDYKVNEYITLKLIFSKTLIYICGVLFLTCQKVALNIRPSEAMKYRDFDNIDDIINFYKFNTPYKGRISISPEEEFWAHCSNIQAWVESDYNTSILARDLSFPILVELCKRGVQRFRTILKEEIIYRIKKGGVNTLLYFMTDEDKYLDYLTEDDLFSGLLLFNEAEVMRNISKFIPIVYTITSSLRDAKDPHFHGLRDKSKLHFCFTNGHITELEILLDNFLITSNQYLDALLDITRLKNLKVIDVYTSDNINTSNMLYYKSFDSLNEIKKEFKF